MTSPYRGATLSNVLLRFPSFISLVSVDYIAYKAIFSLDGKVSEAQNLWYSPGARKVLFVTVVGVATSQRSCVGQVLYPCPASTARSSVLNVTRSPLLPGPSFSGASPLRKTFFVGLFCANNLTLWFGKGITPAQYLPK